jgi:site-specific recombinase XerD
MILAEAIPAFLEGYFSTCQRSRKTQAAYQIDLAQLQAYLGPAIEVSSVEAERLETWASELRLRGYAGISIRRKFATGRIFFAYWVRKGLIDRSPLWRIRLDLGRERMLPRNLSPADAKRLIEQTWRRISSAGAQAANSRNPLFLRFRDLAALEILFATGMRVGELVALRLKDWCEDESSFLVSGKGSRERLAMLPDDRSIRAVKMYLAHRERLNLHHDGFLVNAAGTRISTQGVARMIALNADAAGITMRVTPHMIRHTVATLLLRYGADIRVVQEVLGHASIATTQRYTHVSKDDLLSTLRSRHPNHHLSIDCSYPEHAAPNAQIVG